MKALLLLSLVPVVMWVGQTLLLRRHGLPIRWRIDARDAPRDVRAFGRVIVQASLIGVIVLYPRMIGQSVVAYYQSLLPASRSALQMAHGAAASGLFLCVLFGVWIVTDRMQIEVHQPRRRWLRRLALLGPTALFGACIEELLFRGVVLVDLLESLPSRPGLAFTIAVFVFAGAHYVRSVKRRWTFAGHLMLGVLHCVAFMQTGTLWLTIGLHAGGNLMIMGTRAFVRYRGPAWITGASVFPYAGAVGILGLGILTGFVWTHYGTQ